MQKNFHPLLVFSGDAFDGDKPPATTPLEGYRKILETLRATLEAAGELRGAELETQFTAAKRGVEGLLDGVDEPARSKLRKLLMPPVEGTVSVGKVEGVHAVSTDWRTAVWTFWHGKLAGNRYPFDRSSRSHEAANFAEFASFFQPDAGILWAFVKKNLADWVEAGGDGYVAKRGADPLAPDALSCLSTAQEITDAFFPTGEEPGLKFSVLADWSAPDVTEAKFWVGAKSTVITKGQWARGLKWFGEAAKLEWVQAANPTQEIGRQSFSLYDLFDQLGGLKPMAGGRSGTYTVDAAPLTVKVRADGKGDAFRPDFFSRLHCPADIRMAKP